jgi:protein phosphatase
LTVIDATSVDPDSRKPLVALARKHGSLPVAIVFDVPEEVCVERNRGRDARRLSARAVHRQWDEMHLSLRNLREEGFHQVHVLDSVAAVDAAVVVRQAL